MLQIRKSVVDGMLDHAKKDAPIEACGYLAQRGEVVEAFFPLTNIDASHDHFTLDPKEQFDCVRTIRAGGMRLGAVYHSHPISPARPSEEDKRLAFDPNISYVIISLADGRIDVRAFRIVNNEVSEEKIEVIDNKG